MGLARREDDTNAEECIHEAARTVGGDADACSARCRAQRPAAHSPAPQGRAPTAASSGEAFKVARANDWTVSIAGGLLEGTFIRFAAELAKALDDGDNLRILPIVSHGAAENVDDMLYLRGIDIAITYSDVLYQYKRAGQIKNIDQRISYISELYVGELHVFARPEIKTLADLEGKKVGFIPRAPVPS